MKSILALLAIVVILCATGCSDKADRIPPGTFRATVKNIVENNRQVIVKHVTIEAPGKRIIKIATGTIRLSEATCEPAQDNNLMLAEITFVATFLNTSKAVDKVHWLIQVKGKNVSVGGLSAFGTKTDNLEKVIQLRFNQEFLPLGQDIVVGTVNGETILLSVK